MGIELMDDGSFWIMVAHWIKGCWNFMNTRRAVEWGDDGYLWIVGGHWNKGQWMLSENGWDDGKLWIVDGIELRYEVESCCATQNQELMEFYRQKVTLN